MWSKQVLDENRSPSKNFPMIGAVVSLSPGLLPWVQRPSPGLGFQFLTSPNVPGLKASPSSEFYGQGRWHGSLALCNSSAPVGNSWALWGERGEGSVTSQWRWRSMWVTAGCIPALQLSLHKNALLENIELQTWVADSFTFLRWGKTMVKLCRSSAVLSPDSVS